MIKNNKQQRLVFIIIVTSILIGVLGLTYRNFQKNLMFFYYPSQLLTEKPASKIIRLGGIVKEATIVVLAAGKVEFIVTDAKHDI